MKKYSLDRRCRFYNETFTKWPDSHIWVGKRFIRGVWSIGNNFSAESKEKYYGAYPRGYLNRIFSMFPDVDQVLHLFSGSLHMEKLFKDFPLHAHTLLDGRPDANLYGALKGDANKVSDYFWKQQFDLVLADPPYSIDDAARYKCDIPVNRRRIMRECHKIVKPWGYMVWMDMVKPQWRKDMWHYCGFIAIDRSTLHRVRAIFILRRI